MLFLSIAFGEFLQLSGRQGLYPIFRTIFANELSTFGSRNTNIFKTSHLLGQRFNNIIPNTMMSAPSITASSVTGSIIAVKIPKTKDKIPIPIGLHPPLGGPRRGPLPISSPPNNLSLYILRRAEKIVQTVCRMTNLIYNLNAYNPSGEPSTGSPSESPPPDRALSLTQYHFYNHKNDIATPIKV